MTNDSEMATPMNTRQGVRCILPPLLERIIPKVGLASQAIPPFSKGGLGGICRTLRQSSNLTANPNKIPPSPHPRQARVGTLRKGGASLAALFGIECGIKVLISPEMPDALRLSGLREFIAGLTSPTIHKTVAP